MADEPTEKAGQPVDNGVRYAWARDMLMSFTTHVEANLQGIEARLKRVEDGQKRIMNAMQYIPGGNLAFKTTRYGLGTDLSLPTPPLRHGFTVDALEVWLHGSL